MDQITIKTPNPKCRLYWCLIDFIDWKYSQSCCYFRPALRSIAPLTFSLVGSPTLPLFPVWISTYTVVFTRLQCVRGGGVWAHSKGGGLGQIKTCRQVPLLVIFLEISTFRVWCLYRYLIHVVPLAIYSLTPGQGPGTPADRKTHANMAARDGPHPYYTSFRHFYLLSKK